MPTKILIKRSTTAGEIPTTSDLQTGELAVNTTDKRIFTNNSGTIVELGTTPTVLDVTGNVDVGGTFDVVGQVTVDDITATGTVNLTGATTTVAAPTADSHAATKLYVDTEVNAILDGAPAALDTLNEIAAAINDDANAYTTLTNSIATKLPLAGGTMTGNLVMGANKVTSTATPTADDDLTRKGYVDGILGSATAAATSATNAATSATNAATSASTATTKATEASTSATNAATSESNASASATAASSSATSASNSATTATTKATEAATSATNAANSYDNFDDRYLGAKATDPTVDNDGDALITGAMYFDSTNNVMKVYNGTEWANASSSIEGIKSDFQYTATASQTLFSGNDDDSNELVIDKAGLVNVYLNGVRLSTDDYTVSAAGNSVTLGSGAAVNDIVEIEVFGNFAGQSGADVAITGGSITGLSALGVDGTVTADGLTVEGTTGNFAVSTGGNVLDMTRAGQNYIRATSSAGSMYLGTGAKNNRLVIDSNGDISFYEDTGTTAKFFWDASDEALRIGSTEWPSSYLGKSSNRHSMIADGEPLLLLWDASTGAEGNKSQIMIGGKPTNSATKFAGARIEGGVENATDDDGYLAFDVSLGNSGFTERMRIDSNGNVGIGTDDPTEKLHVDSGDILLKSEYDATGTTDSYMFIANRSGGNWRNSYIGGEGADLIFGTGGTGTDHDNTTEISEAMRIDSSGRVGIGTSSPTYEVGLGDSGGAERFAIDVGSIQSESIHLAANNRHLVLDASGPGNRYVSFKTGTTAYSGSERLTIESGGDVRIKTGSIVVDTVGEGIYLGGTTSANHLDDYEEGTWTPKIVGSTTAGSYSSSGLVENGTYVKIGRMVYLTGTHYGTSGSGSGNLRLNNLPFAIKTSPHTSLSSSLQTNGPVDFPGGTIHASWIGEPSFSCFEVRCTKDNATYNKLAYPTATNYLRFNIVYETDD